MKMKDLPGWRGIRRAFVFSSKAEAMRLVRSGKVATIAGHAGAINVYRGRDGDYRGQLMQYCNVVNSISCASLRMLRQWLDEHLHEIGDTERLAAFR